MSSLLQAPCPTGQWFGVYVALVTDVRDPDGLGRVKLALPWAPDPAGRAYEAWARLATLMGGGSRGTWFVPDPGDEVLVAFEGGDPRTPYVVGGLWNGRDAPPESMDDAGRNTRKVIRTRSGVKITLDDEDGREKLVLETPGGRRITLDDGRGAVEAVDANGNSVTLDASGITVIAQTSVTIQAAQVKLSAGSVTIDAGMSRFSGVVKADTVITNSVVAASYTPGAGNVW